MGRVPGSQGCGAGILAGTPSDSHGVTIYESAFTVGLIAFALNFRRLCNGHNILVLYISGSIFRCKGTLTSLHESTLLKVGCGHEKGMGLVRVRDVEVKNK
jgi:hypothetical protein